GVMRSGSRLLRDFVGNSVRTPPNLASRSQQSAGKGAFSNQRRSGDEYSSFSNSKAFAARALGSKASPRALSWSISDWVMLRHSLFLRWTVPVVAVLAAVRRRG